MSNDQIVSGISSIFNIFLYTFLHLLVMTRNPVYISPAKRAWIRRKVNSGKTKYQIAKELHVSSATVYRWTKDTPSRNIGWPGIRGKTLDMLQELLTKGYCFAKCSNPQNRYMHLHKYFPTIHRICIYRQNILYLDPLSRRKRGCSCTGIHRQSGS